MTKPVRVRYAPSPTGHPHVGNIRTALFNWLFARHNGGEFIVRIEDTDVARRVEGAVETILDALNWLGMDWDEGPDIDGPNGPYFQSQRLELYQKYAEQLVEQGDAYRCFCTPQRLDEMRAAQTRLKHPPGYDRRCRNLSDEERVCLMNKGVRSVIRFRFPLEAQTEFEDIIRGHVSFDKALIDDFVIMKSDGYPTYHLASVVDDHHMGISHVLRAEEWLSSVPRHLELYRALGFAPPRFAHLPIILGSDRSKLSKRHGAVSIDSYREQGYLPQAMVNFLALLGWALDDKTELFSLNELIRSFSLERVSKTGAIFNQEKLHWMNGVYIRALSLEDLLKAAIPFLEKGLPQEVKRPLDTTYVEEVLPLIQERAKTIAEIPDMVRFFFVDKLDYAAEELIAKKTDMHTTILSLEASLKEMEDMSDFYHKTLEGRFRLLAEELGLKAGQLFGTLRIAVTGEKVSPPLFETIQVLGRQRCLERTRQALAKLRQAAK